jgi:hypothetical protein
MAVRTSRPACHGHISLKGSHRHAVYTRDWTCNFQQPPNLNDLFPSLTVTVMLLVHPFQQQSERQMLGVIMRLHTQVTG